MGHKSNAQKTDYRLTSIGSHCALKTDIPPDDGWRIPMKKMMLAAFVALAVTAGIASAGIASLANGATLLLNAVAQSAAQEST
jgi:hypothetical protein